MDKSTEETGALIRELLVAGHDTPDGRLGEIFIRLTRKWNDCVDKDTGPEGQ